MVPASDNRESNLGRINLLKLTLLGSFQSTHNSRDILFRTNKIRALIAYLAVESGQAGVAHPRERLATLLWSESDDKTARQNLRINLSRMRQALDKAAGGPVSQQLFEINNQTIRFNPAALELNSVWCDVTEFRQLLTTCETHDHEDIHYCATCLKRLKEAADLYRGDLLAGIQAEDAFVFEEWLIIARERLLQQAQLALDIIIESYQAQGRHELVREYGLRLLTLEPWRESAHRHIMLALANSGQRTAALSQYERCKAILLDELGAEPSPETAALAQKIESGVGIAEEHEVTRVVASAGPRAPSANNLPAQTTSFFGRNQDIQKLIRFVDDPHKRFVTLVGEGGIGKSRLSLEVGRRLISSFKDGVWLIPLVVLVPTADVIQLENDIATLVCETLNLPLRGKTPPVDQLLAHLKNRNIFLIFDNFEHLLDGANLLMKLLEQTPDLMILASSREPLGFMAETVYRVQPLPLPEHVSDAESQLHNPAVALFIDRVQRVLGDFELGDAKQMAQVTELVHLLGGVPLALELAAAGLRQQSVADLLQSLQQSFDTISVRFRDVPERHQSMRAVFENSWTLLTPAEQRVFALCSVFRGGFWPVAAEAVTSGSGILINNLWEKSLLQRDESGRYSQHELLRQFAAEKRIGFPGMGVQDRHSLYYLNFVAEQTKALIGPRPQDPAAEITLDLDNIRAAWQSAVEQQDSDALLPAIEPLSTFYELRGYYREAAERFAAAAEVFEQEKGSAVEVVLHLRTHQVRALVRMSEHDSALELIGQYLSKTNEFPAIAGLMSLSWGELLWRTGKYDEAEKRLNFVLELGKQANLSELCASAQYHLATVKHFQDELKEAIHLLEVVQSYWQKKENSRRLAQSANNQGIFYFQRKLLEKASKSLEDALSLNQKIGDAQALISILTNLSLIAIDLKQYEKSRRYLLQVLDYSESYGDQLAIANAYQNLGLTYLEAREKEQTFHYLEQSMMRFTEFNNHKGKAEVLLLLGRACLIDFDYKPSLTYLASALSESQYLESASIEDQISTLVESIIKKSPHLKSDPKWSIFDKILSPDLLSQVNIAK
ncbi:MAG: putative ATPase/DNA-binding SARP family transcriptional activator [Cellvibrionaceae bacterium]